MTTLEIEGRKVEVSDDFLKMSPQDQERTVEEIAASLGPKQRYPLMGQLNRGISDAVGGVVDLLNPFDQPHSLNPFPEGTGSARQGLQSAMQAGGVEVAQDDPETLGQAFMRGSGEAAGTMPFATGGIALLRRAPGVVGALATDAFEALAGWGGLTAEVLAGGTAETSRQLAADAGAPDWAQDTAAILGGGVVLPGAIAAPRYLPSVVGARKAAGAVQRAVAPYTEAGGREIARKRLQSLAGGEERAAELAQRIEADNDFGLTPAQQTQDPNMLGVERLAAEQDAALRARLDARRQASQDSGRQAVQELGGDEGDAEAFFRERRDDFTKRLTSQADEAIRRADEQIRRVGPVADEADNSLRVRREVDFALERAVDEEKALWSAVPRGAQISTANTKAAVQRLKDSLSYAQRGDMPQRAGEVLTSDNVYGDQATVNDMHGLYSELRRAARSAMAGTDQNKNLARVANEIADAILADLGAVDADTQIGRAINEARAFSAALHETFDRGAVGRILKRTIDGDTSIDPELSLKRTVGRRGVEGAVGARQIETATEGRASPAIQDYIRDQFSQAVNSATGDFTYGSARKFIRDNKPLLEMYPELRGEIDAAVLARDNADQFSNRIASRLDSLKGKKSAGQAVIDGRTVQAILGSKNPARDARRLANEARRDPSGKALGGIKASFADDLIAGAAGVKAGKDTFSGDALFKMLSDPKRRAALQQIFSAGEMGRLQHIAKDMAKLTAAPDDVGPTLSGEKPSRVIEFMVRVAAAKHGANLGGGSGGSLQTAQMASSRAREFLNRIASDKASQILARAVEDPELFRALLTDMRSPDLGKKVLPRVVPYLVGTAAAQQ